MVLIDIRAENALLKNWLKNCISAETVKKSLEAKDSKLAEVLNEARAKTQQAESQISEFMEIAEMNKMYNEEVVSLRKQVEELQATNQDIHTKFLSMTDLVEKNKALHVQEMENTARSMEETEIYLADHLNQTNKVLDGMYPKTGWSSCGWIFPDWFYYHWIPCEVFCIEPEAETLRVQERIPSYGPDIIKSPWASANAAAAPIRLMDCTQVAKNNAFQVKQATEKINESLWPEEAFDSDLPTCLSQLEKTPAQVSRWKRSAARCGADVALALTKAHFSRIKDEDLKLVDGRNPEGKDFRDHMPTFLEAASNIASFIDLETFVEPIGVPDTPEDELEEEIQEEIEWEKLLS